MRLYLLALLLLSSCATTDEPVRPYPLTDCIVSDNKLGSMGDPVVIVYKGQQIKFCCRPCVKEFNAEPERFLKKLAKGQPKR